MWCAALHLYTNSFFFVNIDFTICTRWCSKNVEYLWYDVKGHHIDFFGTFFMVFKLFHWTITEE